MILDSSTMMVGQYFKRRRELVEILLVSARGIGLSCMYLFIHRAIRYLSTILGGKYLNVFTGLFEYNLGVIIIYVST